MQQFLLYVLDDIAKLKHSGIEVSLVYKESYSIHCKIHSVICFLVASLRFALVVIWMKSIPCLAGNILMYFCTYLYMKELFRTSILTCLILFVNTVA